MDTAFSETESRQGTVTSVDLSRQEPQGEVVDPKSFAAASEEERLAAGVSTMGLYTKRFCRGSGGNLSEKRR
jgi:hypothetical protein